MPGHYYTPALYNAAMKISVYECSITHTHTHARTHAHFIDFIFICILNNEFIVNALLECIKF